MMTAKHMKETPCSTKEINFQYNKGKEQQNSTF